MCNDGEAQEEQIKESKIYVTKSLIKGNQRFAFLKKQTRE